MACNNAAEVNVECEKATTTSLLDLNDFALLQVFSYLNFLDSINLAETSKRLKSVGALHFIKYKRLDLLKYVQSSNSHPLQIETIISYIGQHIEILSINSMRSTVQEAVVDNCVNVTTLKIYGCNDTSHLKKWMQQLKLESLTIDRCSHFNEMSVQLAGLKVLHFTDGNAGLRSMQLNKILEKTTQLQTLTVDLRYRDFSYGVFSKLPKLQCLDIKIYSEHLVNLAEFLQMDGLTKFKVRLTSINNDHNCLQRLNSFLKTLAEGSKLNELRLYEMRIDQKTFRVLKSFHDVTSLGLYECAFLARVFRDDPCLRTITQLVEAQPNLKHLDFMYEFLLIKHVDFVVKNFAKLETFTLSMTGRDLEDLKLDELRISEMLKTSTSRPMLTLYITCYGGNDVKIELRFEQRNHRIVKLGSDDSYF